MAVKDAEALRFDLTNVDDVSGADSKVRDEVARRTVVVETASVALRAAVRELHEAEDEAWKHYAGELEAATLRFDSALGTASARLRAERAASKPELEQALQSLADSWRARADEIRVQTHLGQLDARDAGLHAIDDLDQSAHRVGQVLTSLRSDAGQSLASLQGQTRHALDEIGHVLRDLRPAKPGPTEPEPN